MSILIADETKPHEFPYSNFEGPSHPCFLCGNPVGGGKVIHWGGVTATSILDKNEPEVIKKIRRKRKVAGLALNIYFHPDCVPSLCRRILMDWETVHGINVRGYSKRLKPVSEE